MNKIFFKTLIQNYFLFSVKIRITVFLLELFITKTQKRCSMNASSDLKFLMKISTDIVWTSQELLVGKAPYDWHKRLGFIALCSHLFHRKQELFILYKRFNFAFYINTITSRPVSSLVYLSTTSRALILQSKFQYIL